LLEKRDIPGHFETFETSEATRRLPRQPAGFAG
jgi:hypothetical protein